MKKLKISFNYICCIYFIFFFYVIFLNPYKSFADINNLEKCFLNPNSDVCKKLLNSDDDKKKEKQALEKARQEQLERERQLESERRIKKEQERIKKKAEEVARKKKLAEEKARNEKLAKEKRKRKLARAKLNKQMANYKRKAVNFYKDIENYVKSGGNVDLVKLSDFFDVKPNPKKNGIKQTYLVMKN